MNVGPLVAVVTPLSEWQNLYPSSGGGVFYEFCDALEVLHGKFVPGSDGWGLGHALVAWANYSRHTLSSSEWVQ